MRFRQLLPLFGALFALYIIWGSTYFVIRIGVESWPPLMMAGVRFLSAGMLLMAFLLLRGEKLPPLRQTINAALIGLLLLAVGNGGGASKRAIGHCCRRGRHCPAIYAVL